jgi:hypothetical protein
LAHFDPDTDLEVGEEVCHDTSSIAEYILTQATLTIPSKAGPPTSGYHSTWEELLRVHVTHVPSTGPAQERTVRQDPTPSTAIPSSSSETLLLPFGAQHSTQMSRQPQPDDMPKTHNSHRRVQRADQSHTRGLRGVFGRHEVSRFATPTQSQGLNSSLSTFQPNRSTTSTISTFSFQAPTRADYPVQRAPHYEHNPRQTSTRYLANTGTFTGSAQPPAHTPSQSSTTLIRPRTCNFYGLRIAILTVFREDGWG